MAFKLRNSLKVPTIKYFLFAIDCRLFNVNIFRSLVKPYTRYELKDYVYESKHEDSLPHIASNKFYKKKTFTL